MPVDIAEPREAQMPNPHLICFYFIFYFVLRHPASAGSFLCYDYNVCCICGLIWLLWGNIGGRQFQVSRKHQKWVSGVSLLWRFYAVEKSTTEKIELVAEGYSGRP